MAGKPNVLFILSDQHNAKFMSCTGKQPDVKTPNLDRLAAEGVRFENAVTQITICMPSRICFASGQYCHNHGRYGFSHRKPKALPTVFGHFRRAGYRTVAVGKMHCPDDWLEDDCDEFYETDRTSKGGSCREYLDHLTGRGIDIYKEYGLKSGPSPFDYADSQEGWSARKVIDIMRRSADAGRPFFVHLSLTKPHQPYTPARRFWEMYDEGKITLPPNADYDLAAAGKAPYVIDVAERARRSENFEAERLKKLRGYLGNVTHCDFAVGEILAFLDEQGMAEDTIIVYSADHGEYACEHGPNEKVPGIAADAVTRIPMLWRWGGRFKAGHVAEQLVESVDVAATLCALAGLERMETADGKDLSPLLDGRGVELRRIAVTEFPFSRSVRKGKWRLVYYPPGFFGDRRPDGFGELYDLQADPWEMKNLYYDKRCTEVVRDIERDLLDWLVTTTRPVDAYTPIRLHPADGKVHPDDLWAGLPCGAYL